MGEKNFVLSFYKNADSGFHVQKIKTSQIAQEKHSHSYYQIYYIIHGGLTHVTDGEECRLVKGDAFIIPPGHPHRVCDIEDALFYTFAFTEESVSSAQSHSLVSRFLQDIKSNESTRAKIPLKDEALLLTESLMEELYKEFCEKKIGYTDTMKAYATVLLTTLARHHFENAELTISHSDSRTRILYCIEYVDQNFGESLSLAEMAKWTAMSCADFCKHFRSVTGTTFLRYLNRTRIENARLMIDKGIKISAVSGFCGYNDFSTFYRNFKAIVGCSPEQYRKKRT